MPESDPDPRLSPRAVRLAQPFIQGFVSSPFCPATHEWHARTTLPLLALYVAAGDDPRADHLAWASLDPDALLGECLELSPDDLDFIQDLFDVAASFYAYLGAEGALSWQSAEALRGRLAQLALTLSARHAA